MIREKNSKLTAELNDDNSKEFQKKDEEVKNKVGHKLLRTHIDLYWYPHIHSKYCNEKEKAIKNWELCYICCFQLSITPLTKSTLNHAFCFLRMSVLSHNYEFLLRFRSRKWYQNVINM